MSSKFNDYIKNMHKRKIVTAAFISAALVLVSFMMIIFDISDTPLGRLFGAKAASSQQEVRTARVEKGDLIVSVTGSGTVSWSNRVDIFPGEIAATNKVHFKEGDKVTAGALLYELDDTEARTDIAEIKNAVAQTQLSLDSIISEMRMLKAKASTSGFITELDVREGDSVEKGETVLKVIDNSKFKLTVPFYSFVSLKIGQPVRVTLLDFLTTVEGKVSAFGDKTYTNSEGTVVRNVEISIENPGYSLDGLKASAETNGIDSVRSAAISYWDIIPVKSEASGKIEKLHVRNEQYVRTGDLLFEINSNELENSKKAAELKMEELVSQLEMAEHRLERLKIYSPVSGVIVSQNARVNNIAKPGMVLATIADPDQVEFSVAVNELDIGKVQIGQRVYVTVDALSETLAKPLTGHVSKIAHEGTTADGAATYPVTVLIDEPLGIKVGMNLKAKIIIDEKRDILIVPFDAIQEINGKAFVLVDEGSINKREVKTGINNDEYIEIISGLREGELVVLPAI